MDTPNALVTPSKPAPPEPPGRLSQKDERERVELVERRRHRARSFFAVRAPSGERAGRSRGCGRWPARGEDRRSRTSDEQIAEVIAIVSLQLLTAGFNRVAGIEPAPEDAAELTSRTTP